MKKYEEGVVIGGSKKRYNIKEKIYWIIALSLAIVMFGVFTMHTNHVNQVFAEEVDAFSKLNAKTVFSIDKIYLYSSASGEAPAENNNVSWNLNLFQYTDIAIYINNNSDTIFDYSNSIKELKISNVQFKDLKTGKPALYFKSINNFAKYVPNSSDYKIEKEFNYEVLNDGELDYATPKVYADVSNPITLEYLNTDIKNASYTDVTEELTYDGSLLRKSSVNLNDIACTLIFNITIINNYNQEFVSTVSLKIPLEDDFTGNSIYDGKIVKTIEDNTTYRFFRTK